MIQGHFLGCFVRLQSLGGEVEIWPEEAQFQNILWFGEEGIAPKQI